MARFFSGRPASSDTLVARATHLAAILFLSAGLLPARESFRLFPPPPAGYFSLAGDSEPRTFALGLAPAMSGGPETLRVDLDTADLGSPSPLTGTVVRMPSRTKTWLITAGVLLGSAYSSLGTGHQREAFHFGNEEWFGEGTYAGGADKASHFVFYNGLSRELGVTYRNMGYATGRAVSMSFLTSVAAGTLVEIGDGLTVFGFAWEDLAMDTLGAGTAALVTLYDLDDTVGFRFGKIGADQPPVCCRTPGVGKDYSEEIYTADLKIEGFARRMKVRPGPARFLLLSMTYGSKGYRYSLSEFRQRNIGVEIGLNFPEILSAVGVPERTWWGRLIYMVFNFVRIPFTQIGYYYDLNHGKWHGPDSGNVFDPGP
jgi:hypothetical protein